MSKIDSSVTIDNRRDYDTTFTATFSEPTAGTTVITPTTGHRLQIVSIVVNTAQTTGEILFRFLTSLNLATDFYMASGTQTQYEWNGYVIGNKDEVLTMITTTPVDGKYNVTVNYKQYPN